jgi:hypothetical protein
MDKSFRRRRTLFVTVLLGTIMTALFSTGSLTLEMIQPSAIKPPTTSVEQISALNALDALSIKGRAPKTDYSRLQFGNGWGVMNGCDTRNIILNRDLSSTLIDTNCDVTKGTLNDPYTGKVILFTRGSGTSADVQIDHVVALSDAWQTGAQDLTKEVRTALANDPLELLAVDGPANQQKSDGDAATWLPSNKAFRCQYVARQVAVKQKYFLWVTQSERDAIKTVLVACPSEGLPLK